MYFTAFILTDFIEYARQKGANIRFLEEEFSSLKGDTYVDYNTIVNVINELGRELQDEYLGLHLGEQITLKATASVDRIMQNSETLEKSFSNAVDYSKLISDALECSLVQSDGYYTVVFEENPNWRVLQAYARRQILDLTALCCLKSLITYTKRTYYPVQINFHTSRPKSLTEYYRLFNTRLKFNQPRTEIIFSRQIFEKHSKPVELGLIESLKEKVADEISNLDTENEIIYHIKKCILRHKPQRISVALAASELNLSSRTLQRRLKRLNTHYKAIEHELQLNLSKTYLKERRMSVEEISYLLGFSESSAFIRFFKALTKLTPTEFMSKSA